VLDSRYKQFFVSRQHATLTCMVDRAGVPSFVINDNAVSFVFVVVTFV
jgi:pSer/pThr/pTyr-binding forkhead associated (FHA) protein